MSNNDSCSPKHWPDPARTRKLRKSEHTLKTNGEDPLAWPFQPLGNQKCRIGLLEDVAPFSSGAMMINGL